MIKALREVEINESVLKYKGLDSLKYVANGRATKIYMPSDITELVSKVGVIGESLGIGDSTPVDYSEPLKPAPSPDPCNVYYSYLSSTPRNIRKLHIGKLSND